MTKYEQIQRRIKAIEYYQYYLTGNNVLKIQGRTPCDSVGDMKMEYYQKITEIAEKAFNDIYDIVSNQLEQDHKKLNAIEELLR